MAGLAIEKVITNDYKNAVDINFICRFWRVIKIMEDIANRLNEDEFFEDPVDIPKEGVDQHRNRECLKGAISKGKGYLPGGKEK